MPETLECAKCGGEMEHDELHTCMVGAQPYTQFYRVQVFGCTGCGTVRHGGGDYA